MNGEGALLTYTASTIPAPLQVSPPSGDPSLGTVGLVVSNDGDVAILCTAIELTFQSGVLAQDASSDFSGVTLNVRSGNWAFDSPVAVGVFTARPKTPADAEIAKDGLELEVGNLEMNQQVGTFELQITETSSLQGGSPQPRNLSLPIPKFPYLFTVSDFQASAYDVEPGGSVMLLWQGSAAISSSSRNVASRPTLTQNRTRATTPTQENDDPGRY